MTNIRVSLLGCLLNERCEYALIRKRRKAWPFVAACGTVCGQIAYCISNTEPDRTLHQSRKVPHHSQAIARFLGDLEPVCTRSCEPTSRTQHAYCNATYNGKMEPFLPARGMITAPQSAQSFPALETRRLFRSTQRNHGVQLHSPAEIATLAFARRFNEITFALRT